MKEFDYEKAKAGAPVCTRDGRPARIVCWDFNGISPENKLIVLIQNENGHEAAYLYDENGRYLERETTLDLMMAPVKREGWGIVYRHKGYPKLDQQIFTTIDFATMHARDMNLDMIDIVKIEWEE